MRRTWAQFRKELTQLLRDWRTLGLALVLPIVLLLLMSSAIAFVATDLPLVVQDLDNTPASRNLTDAFRASLTFHVVAWPPDRQPTDALRSGAARAVLVIPAHFERALLRGESPAVQLLIDASDANTAQQVAGYAGEITAAYNNQAQGAAAPVQAAIRLWYNPGRSSEKFFGPGVFVLALSMFPTLLAALSMAKEDELKTILQVYVSNISAHEYLLGKVLAFMAVAAAESLIMLALLLTHFGLRFVGDPTPFLVATLLYAFCVACFGSMVGAAIPSQVVAIQAVAFGGFLLVFLLSGFMFPVANIPIGLRWISNIVWGRYYIEIVRNALLAGGEWVSDGPRVLMIGALGALFYALAWLRLRRMQVRS